MDTLHRIISIMDEKDISQKQLTDYLGLQNTAFTKWKAGSNTSYVKHLPKISDFLGVSIDYLLGKTDEKNKPTIVNDDELSEILNDPMNREMLELLKQLTFEQRNLIHAQIRGILSSRPNE